MVDVELVQRQLFAVCLCLPYLFVLVVHVECGLINLILFCDPLTHPLDGGVNGGDDEVFHSVWLLNEVEVDFHCDLVLL